MLVAGAVGPLGVRLEPYGPTSVRGGARGFREQMRGAQGRRRRLLHARDVRRPATRSSRRSLAARDVDPTMPVIAQMTDRRRRPHAVRRDAGGRRARARRAGAPTSSASTAPSGRRRSSRRSRRWRRVTRRKLSAQPNAGMPRDVGGRSMYMASPEYMATYARHLVQAGAKVVGGCCGTTPEHIRAMCEGVRPLQPAARAAGRGGASSVAAPPVAAATSAHRARRRASAVPLRASGRSWAREARRGRVRHVRRDRAAARRGRDAHARRRRARSRTRASTR